MNRSNHRLITTDDGSRSIYSNTFGEAMHSTSGAYEESLLKHVIPSRILEHSSDCLNVLDVGFGIGYNLLALIVEFLKVIRNTRLNIVSYETDFSHLALINDISFGDSRDPVYCDILKAARYGRFASSRYSITIYNEDARTGIRKLNNNFFDAVFHDPFSPAKNPELWSIEFFSEERRVMKDHCILTTYSSALHARRAMVEAGLTIGRGPSVGRKREGTLAAIHAEIPLIETAELSLILDSMKSCPFRDPDLNDSREIIIERRRREIQAKKDHPVHR